MAPKRCVVARLIQYDVPDWAPLAGVVCEDLMGTFMWMHEVGTSAGLRIHAYKHIDTRRYVHLDHEGNAFVYLGDDRYRRIDLAAALELALEPWWEYPDVTPEEIAAAWAAIDRARRAAKDRLSS